MDQPVFFQLSELPGQHFLRYFGQGSFQFAKAQGVFPKL
jgi:hypothetical protein